MFKVGDVVLRRGWDKVGVIIGITMEDLNRQNNVMVQGRLYDNVMVQGRLYVIVFADGIDTLFEGIVKKLC